MYENVIKESRETRHVYGFSKIKGMNNVEEKKTIVETTDE